MKRISTIESNLITGGQLEDDDIGIEFSVITGAMIGGLLGIDSGIRALTVFPPLALSTRVMDHAIEMGGIAGICVGAVTGFCVAVLLDR